jgi:serine/threonine protein kinase
MKYCTACHKTYPTGQDVCPADHTKLQVAHELQPGMIIRNKYQILSRIGIGGMGLVYCGRHLTFNELCAIKIVNDDIAGDATFLQRFQTEAVVTRKLRHPNAVRVDDFDYTEDGRPFIVMELVEGKNISEILQTEGALAVPRAVRIARQVALAIAMAHKLGIVHRDLKPGNIILTTDDHGQEVAKVLDFGIAKLREAAGESRPEMTMTGMVVGTPLYMSPEQFMGKKAGGEIDGRTDIYSLGVVLYQMVTAQLPFEAETPYALMLQHLQGAVTPPHELKPELHIPEALSRVILKAMEKSREQRFQTAEEFVAALDGIPTDTFANAVAGNATPEPAPAAPAASAVTAQPVTAAKTASKSEAASGIVTQASPVLVASVQSDSVQSGSVQSSSPQPNFVPSSSVPSGAVASGNAASSSSVDPQVINSAAQHVFLPPRSFPKLILRVGVVILAGVLVVGAGYLKYRSVRRTKIEHAVTEQLNSAPSETLRKAGVRVSVSQEREVTLDGKVPSPEDSAMAEWLATSVADVVQVNNRLIVPPAVTVESSESLINRGMTFLDEGDYPSAIECFRKALADPNNKGAQQMLDRAQRAQQTEEELLKNRQ